MRPANARPPTAADPAANWHRQPERGSRGLLGAAAYLSLRLGRRCGRVILYGIAVYFFLFASAARVCMRDYLRRALGREPLARDRFRLVMNFASTVQDRLYLLAGRYEQFEISVQGESLVREILDSRSGAFLFGAHVGSFEVLRSIGQRQPGLEVAMAMYEDNARKINAILAAAAPQNPPEIIPLGRVEAMLKIRERLDEGAFVGMLADRTFGDEPSLAVSFLGATARLPLGPMRAAALMRRQVIFMLGPYRGHNHYHIIFEPLADFSKTPASQLKAAVEAAVTRYAIMLEQFCRTDPYNWFNFFDFWRGAENLPAPAANRPIER